MRFILHFFFKKIKKLNCVCENPPVNYLNYFSCNIGIDETKGRFAELVSKSVFIAAENG
jgi:hypothetical protein